MKKLIVTAIGAAAAFGASADLISTQRFESVTGEFPQTVAISNLNEWAGGTYWGDGNSETNAYKVESYENFPYVQATILGTPITKALSIETSFDEPLEYYIKGDNGTTKQDMGVYFDSMVKFTVCDEEPPVDTNEVNSAKIAMWLQSFENDTVTNLMVKAGYLSYADGKVSVTPHTYTCQSIDGTNFDIEKFHRVTIKTIADISANGRGVPGFAIFIDGKDSDSSYTYLVGNVGNADADKWDSNFSENVDLNYNAQWLSNPTRAALFPSLVQTGTAENKGQLKAVGFSGLGSITDLAFADTDDGMSFAADQVDEPTIATATIDNEAVATEYKSFSDLIEAVNCALSSASIALAADTAIDAPIVLTTTANVTLDFAGFVITNAGEYAAITNASNLTIINSVGNGGIYCTDESSGVAIYDSAATLTIQGGSFWGNVTLNEGGIYLISGGSFLDDTNFEEFDCLAPGKTFEENQETGMHDVVDDDTPTTYTITVADGEHMTIAVTTNDVSAGAAGDYVLNAGDKIEVTYTADTGYTLSKDSDSIASVSAEATIAAPVATLLTYKVIFVDGDAATTNIVNYGAVVGVVPPFVGKTGYTAAWDSDPTEVASVTSDLTFTAVYTANVYSVKFYTNSEEYATATYTYGDASTFSTPSDPSIDGFTFGGWFTDNGTFEAAFTFDATVADNTQAAYAKLTSSGGGSGVEPGADDGNTYDTQADAEAAAAGVTVAVPSAVEAALTPAQKADYTDMFAAKAVSNGDGTYSVKVELKPAVEAEVQTAVDTATTATLEDVLEVAAGETTGVTVTTKPGLYYAIAVGTSLPLAAPSSEAYQMATDTTKTINVTKPNTGTAFFKVYCSETK